MSDASAVLESSALKFEFPGSFELDCRPITIRRGSRAVCFGPSGCGKTTLLRILTGILSPTSGTVNLAGKDLGQLSPPDRREWRFRKVGLVFQDFALLSAMTVLDNLTLPAHLAGRDPHATRDQARQLADRLGISRTLGRRPERVSQGERQRAAIVRSLLTEPDLIVCDEPTANLDPARSRLAIEVLVEEAARIDAGLLVVTHDHGLLDAFDQQIEIGSQS